jgi:hypothetical protein
MIYNLIVFYKAVVSIFTDAIALRAKLARKHGWMAD